MIAAAARIYRSIWSLHDRNLANVAGYSREPSGPWRGGGPQRDRKGEESRRRGRGGRGTEEGESRVHGVTWRGRGKRRWPLEWAVLQIAPPALPAMPTLSRPSPHPPNTLSRLMRLAAWFTA